MGSTDDGLSLQTTAMHPATASMSSEDDPIPPEQLVDLPVEMQLRILSHLPPKEIQCFRRVNQHFCKLIDVKVSGSHTQAAPFIPTL